MRIRRICDALVAVLAALGLSACGPDVGDITVGQKVDQAIDSTRGVFDAASEKTADAAITVATAARQTVVGARDTAITASIKADLLKDPYLSSLKIEVVTREGVVTLNGVAPTVQGAERAGVIAQSVAGVQRVRNFVTPRKR